MRAFVIALLLLVPCASLAESGNSEAKERLVKYLSSVRNFSAKVMQVAPNGAMSKAVVSFLQPRNMRMDYLTPQRNVIFLRDRKLTFYDCELDQVSFATIPPHPLIKLFSVASDRTILDTATIEEGVKTMRVTIATHSDELNESITAYFRLTEQGDIESLSRIERVEHDIDAKTSLYIEHIDVNREFEDGFFTYQHHNPQKNNCRAHYANP